MALGGGRRLTTRMEKQGTAQPDRAGGQGDGEVALFETGADFRRRGGRFRDAPAAPESGWKFQRANRKMMAA
jgi:hypothetical protein